jgi:beta-ureidopropionase / N-carbamoyl-L-amino-acid hydrolase
MFSRRGLGVNCMRVAGWPCTRVTPNIGANEGAVHVTSATKRRTQSQPASLHVGIVLLGDPRRGAQFAPDADRLPGSAMRRTFSRMHRRTFSRQLLATSASLALAPRLTFAAQQAPRVDADRLNGHLRELSRFGRNDKGGVDRIAYSAADVEARRYVMDLMLASSLDVRTDAAGNIIGRRAGRAATRPALLTGSHIDSVPQGGNYDGQVGSMGAIEVAHALADARMMLRHPLEVVIFQNEENGKIGSKAMRGDDPATYLDLMTHSGRTVRDGIRALGGDPDRVREARRERGSIAACIELHIEQGAVLEAARTQIGVVQGIVGIKRWDVVVDGFANHAGTTPMDRRQDALVAAARFIDAVHRTARELPGRHVATVGVIRAEPGAPNVIPGRVTLTLEIRDVAMTRIDELYALLQARAGSIASDTQTKFGFTQSYRTEPAAANEQMQEVIEKAARGLGYSTMRLPSGAGHDAQEIAQLAPMGMIFVPSRGGISHSAEEYSAPEQIAAGANVLLHTLLALDSTLP